MYRRESPYYPLDEILAILESKHPSVSIMDFVKDLESIGDWNVLDCCPHNGSVYNRWLNNELNNITYVRNNKKDI